MPLGAVQEQRLVGDHLGGVALDALLVCVPPQADERPRNLGHRATAALKNLPPARAQTVSAGNSRVFPADIGSNGADICGTKGRERWTPTLSACASSEMVRRGPTALHREASSLIPADATFTTVEFALRDLFRRDRVWRERRQTSEASLLGGGASFGLREIAGLVSSLSTAKRPA
jgi:hypothetical protein